MAGVTKQCLYLPWVRQVQCCCIKFTFFSIHANNEWNEFAIYKGVLDALHRHQRPLYAIKEMLLRLQFLWKRNSAQKCEFLKHYLCHEIKSHDNPCTRNLDFYFDVFSNNFVMIKKNDGFKNPRIMHPAFQLLRNFLSTFVNFLPTYTYQHIYYIYTCTYIYIYIFLNLLIYIFKYITTGVQKY